MKTEVKKLDSTKREVSIEVSGDTVKNKFEDVFKRIAKDAKVPGFRAGHAPRDILEKHYSSSAYQQVVKELVPEVYDQAVQKEGLEVIELPSISQVKLDRAALSFKATVEVRPEIQVKNYKGLKASYKKIEVTPDEIKQSLSSLKEARKTDVAPNVVTQADSHRHPEETPQSDAASGIDDNFARGLGYPSLSELERALEKQIYIQKENLQRKKIEDGIVEALSKGLDFKLPQSLVERQLQDSIRRAKLDWALKGIPREKIDGQEKALSEALEPEARRQVKVYLIMADIAKKENIPIDDHMPDKVMEFLLREAQWLEGD